LDSRSITIGLVLVRLAPRRWPTMRIITATIYRTPMPEILGEALYELACLAQLFPAIWWPLR
jgi:hypothetical protein